MSFGNELAVDIQIAENELFDYNYGSILVEATEELSLPAAQYIGTVIEGTHLIINNERVSREALLKACCGQFDKIYPSAVVAQHQALMPANTLPNSLIASSPIAYNGPAVETPVVYIPVFPGTNCDYDSAKAWRKAGAEVETTIFRNLTGEDVLSSIDEMVEHINRCHILMFAGGFSAGDEPDGSGKFIASVINNQKVGAAITALIDRGGLILGICNGFQALVKSGLLPYGKLGMVTPDSPTLFRNDINRHISQMVTTTVATTVSPWLRGMQVGDTHSIAVSHGEGKFVVNEALAKEFFENGQVAFRYADPMTGEATMEAPYNPNGSYYAIEGIVSRNGQILGKMGHTERWEEGVFTNIAGNKCQPLFENAVAYFRKK
jgi:phosphoribosylformylglycinamidine synthase